jgi:hypothetical protein
MVILSGTPPNDITLALQHRGISGDAIPILQKPKDTIEAAFNRLKSQSAQAVRPEPTEAGHTSGVGFGNAS